MAQTIVALTTLTDVIQRALAKYPEHRSRIENGAALVVLGHILRHTDGHYVVESQTNPGQRYVVTRDSCSCEDRRRHQERACKHLFGVRMLLIAEERQRKLDQREQLGPMQIIKLRVLQDRVQRGEVAV